MYCRSCGNHCKISAYRSPWWTRRCSPWYHWVFAERDFGVNNEKQEEENLDEKENVFNGDQNNDFNGQNAKNLVFSIDSKVQVIMSWFSQRVIGMIWRQLRYYCISGWIVRLGWPRSTKLTLENHKGESRILEIQKGKATPNSNPVNQILSNKIEYMCWEWTQIF